MPAPAQTLATHVLNQTLASIATLESLNLISSADAHLIRSKLPSPTGPFPSLDPSRDLTSSFGALSVSPPASGQYGQAPPPNYQNNNQQYTSEGGGGPPALPPRGRVEQRAKALWDYHGAEPDDLAFRQGDTILIDDEVNEQWYRGRVIPQGQNYPLERSGLFPSNYIEKLPSGGGYYQSPPSQMVPYNPPGQPQPYGYEKQNYNQQAPPQHMMVHQPPPQHQQLQVQQQPGQTVVVAPEEKKSKFGKIGGQLGNAAVNGAGFGFGASIASEMVHKIF